MPVRTLQFKNVRAVHLFLALGDNPIDRVEVVADRLLDVRGRTQREDGGACRLHATRLVVPGGAERLLVQRGQEFLVSRHLATQPGDLLVARVRDHRLGLVEQDGLQITDDDKDRTSLLAGREAPPLVAGATAKGRIFEGILLALPQHVEEGEQAQA
jgi:hypothetical protein